MITEFKLWLREQLYGISAVRACAINRPEADLVVLTWVGTFVHIHLVQEPLKLRQLQRAVKAATESSIASMYLVDASLLPSDGKRSVPKEWMFALQALTDGRIYVFDKTEQGSRVRQMHFEQIANTEEQEAWYGSEIAIARLPIYPNWVKGRVMKGNWLIAHFDTDAFWQRADYRQARSAFRHDQRSQMNGSQSNGRRYYTNTDWQNSGADRFSFIPSAPRTKFDECCEVLGVERTASEEQVKTAFRKKALEFHPDTSNLPKDEAEMKFRQLSEAYDFVREHKGW